MDVNYLAVQLEAKDIEGGLETARLISNGFLKRQALQAVAVAQTQTRDLQGAQETLRRALATAGRLPDPNVKS